MRIQERVEAHQKVNIRFFLEKGSIPEMMFCESDYGVALLKPLTEDALRISDWDRAQILAGAARFSDSHVIGRCDLLYSRFAGYLIKLTNQDHLHRLAEIDPSIVRTLLVHSIDVRTGEPCESSSFLSIDEEGIPNWNIEFGSPYSVQLMLPLYATVKLINKKQFKLGESEKDLAAFLKGLGWGMSIASSTSEPRRIV